MMNLLHTIGLMTRAEHERLMDYSVSFHHKRFKRAATDLAAQAEEIEQYRGLIAQANSAFSQASDRIDDLEAEIAALRPDAEAMRKKRAADRKRMAGKRNG